MQGKLLESTGVCHFNIFGICDNCNMYNSHVICNSCDMCDICNCSGLTAWKLKAFHQLNYLHHSAAQVQHRSLWQTQAKGTFDLLMHHKTKQL